MRLLVHFILASNFRRLIYTEAQTNVTLVKNAMEQWENQFIARNISEPQSSIKNIMAYVLNLTKPGDVDLHMEKELTSDQIRKLTGSCQCRLARMPVQYIIKEWDFREFKLEMCQPVFIPRPETEQLIDIIQGRILSPNRVLEVGCGSGAISIALLKLYPTLYAVAVDRSKAAVELTFRNARRYNVSDRIFIYHSKLQMVGTFTNPVPANLVDLIVSNPPYLPKDKLKNLPPEVLMYEDIHALDGGKEGLKVVFSVLYLAGHILPEGGNLFMEIDPSQVKSIKDFIIGIRSFKNLSIMSFSKDFNGLDRYVHISMGKHIPMTRPPAHPHR